jgi:AcrR family transcriptional regulator
MSNNIENRMYRSPQRSRSAGATRESILSASLELFTEFGIDKVTIAKIARKAAVSQPTVYAVFKSKEGILRELMRAALFGPRYEQARAVFSGVSDPVELVRLTAHVARAIYESEADELGMLRGASSFSPSLRRLQQEFEDLRYDMQKERIAALAASGRLKSGLAVLDARRIMWMLTSRDIYRMLVIEGGWLPAKFQAWLEKTLMSALVEPDVSQQN